MRKNSLSARRSKKILYEIIGFEIDKPFHLHPKEDWIYSKAKRVLSDLNFG
jgi:hypothetical protein